VNLGSGEVSKEPFPEKVRHRFIGGKGLGAYLLLKELPPGINPLSQKNKLILATGPVEGTYAPGAARLGAFFKSPSMGGFGESYLGGHIAGELKYAGYDALILEGAAKSPVYLVIRDGEVEIRDASHLWGRDALETEAMLHAELGEAFQVLSIGPAGERLVKYACLSHVARQAGRRGGGTVMGTKKLKAIAVRGTGGLQVSEPERLSVLIRELQPKISRVLATMSRYGTGALLDLLNKIGSLPTYNWREGTFADVQKISALTMREQIVIRDKACLGCQVACGKVSQVRRGPYAGALVEGAEYETLYALGSNLGMTDINAVAKLNDVADRLGIDTISLGGVLGFVAECFERGLLSRQDLDGLEPRFGEAEAFLGLTEKIALREGIGDLLAEGVKVAAKEIGRGASDFALHFKGIEPPGFDPRGFRGCGLSLSVATKGGCHFQAIAHRAQMAGHLDRFSTKGQAANVKKLEDLYALRDSLIFCGFLMLPPELGVILWEETAKFYQYITGHPLTADETGVVGERIYNLGRLFNIREGLGKADDLCFPPRLGEPLPAGPAQGQVLTRVELEEMVHEYYSLRGWSGEGVPSKAKLEELGIGDYLVA